MLTNNVSLKEIHVRRILLLIGFHEQKNEAFLIEKRRRYLYVLRQKYKF